MNKLAGFVTCKILNREQSQIGLIGVDKEYQGKKIGTLLVQFLENYLIDMNINILKVITEGSNISAQNFYIKNGFFVRDVKYISYLFKDDKNDPI